MPSATPGIDWATGLIRLEIALWERIDARLLERHDLSLAFFEALHFVARAAGHGVRVGDLARAMRVTVGGASKLADRIVAAGLLARRADAGDRRASRLVLTPAGRRKLTAASKTYEGEVERILIPVLGAGGRARMHDDLARLLGAVEGEAAP